MGENANPADKDKEDALYEDREPKKIIRIITVTAYMISVSFVGIVLSTYYIFLWNPPNPRLMHAQAIESHSERLVDDGLTLSRRVALPVGADSAAAAATADRIDLFSTQKGIDGDNNSNNEDEAVLKLRREIAENVNNVLRANFEKARLDGLMVVNDTLLFSGNISSPLLPDNVTDTVPLTNTTESISPSSPIDPIDSFSVPKNTTSTTTTTKEEPSTATTDSSSDISSSSSVNIDSIGSTANPASIAVALATTATPGSRWTKNLVKKQHQTPFALKHLEVPIKFDFGLRKRPLRITTTTTADASASDATVTTTERPLVSLDTKDRFQNKQQRVRAMQIPRKMSAQNVMASISRTLGTNRHQQQHYHHHNQPPYAVTSTGCGNNDCGKQTTTTTPVVAPNEVRFANDESKERLYLPKHKQKLVRVLTVVAYIISVSLAAIVLSLYYMYIWDPSDHAYNIAKLKANATAAAAAAVSAGINNNASSTVKTLCVELGQAVANEPIVEGTSPQDGTTPLATTTESYRSSPDGSGLSPAAAAAAAAAQPTRSLYKTLTTPPSRRNDFQDYSSSSSSPPSGILAERLLQATRRLTNDNDNDKKDEEEINSRTIAPVANENDNQEETLED